MVGAAIPGIVLGCAGIAGAAGEALAARQRDMTGTWLDAFNFLDLIAGPPFLLLFVVYTVVVMFLLFKGRNATLQLVEPMGAISPTGRLPMELKPTYLELAWLKGGRKAVVEAALCNLYRMGLVSRYLKVCDRATSASLSEFEKSVFQACVVKTPAHKIATHARVRNSLSRFEREARVKLGALGFLPTGTTYLLAVVFMAMTITIVDGLGWIRVQRSVMRGYQNVQILQFLMGIAGIVAVGVLWPRISGAGLQYLGSVRDIYKAMVRKAQARCEPGDSPEILYAIAACGASAMGGTGYADIHAVLQPPRPASSCSGCSGGGCSGGSCGGGGCGGGGCGGGGCGGG